MRKKVIAGNWKMNMTPTEAAALAERLKNGADTDKSDVIFCVPATDIYAVSQAVKGSNISVGAQNMFFEDNGAYTGEISANMLLDMGVRYVIIGHSERRELFAETNETVNKKVLKAFEKGIVPIMCVGESLVQREKAVTIEWIRMQVKVGLFGVKSDAAKKLIIAYEPIWAIGTGKTATSAQAQEVCSAIRAVLAEIYDADTAEATRVQYGGSVTGANAGELFGQPDIDGGLVGGASLKDDFIKIVNY